MAFAIMFVVGGVLAGVMMAALDLPIGEDVDVSNPKVILVFILSTVAGLLTALGYAVQQSGWAWIRFGLPSAKDTGIAVVLVPVVMLVSYGWSMLMQGFGGEVEPQIFAQGILDLNDQRVLVFSLLYTVLGASFLEELLFRGYMLPIMVRALGKGRGMVLNAVLFGLVHASDPWAVVPTMVIGFAACWLREKTGSLTAPVLFHAVNNLCAMALMWAGY